MKKIISIFSFLFFLTPIAFAQDGVRYVKKQPNSTEAKPTTKTTVNTEKVVVKDSTSTSKIENKNKNSEKTSTPPKK